jgi:hypothetical protein
MFPYKNKKEQNKRIKEMDEKVKEKMISLGTNLVYFT